MASKSNQNLPNIEYHPGYAHITFKGKGNTPESAALSLIITMEKQNGVEYVVRTYTDKTIVAKEKE